MNQKSSESNKAQLSREMSAIKEEDGFLENEVQNQSKSDLNMVIKKKENKINPFITNAKKFDKMRKIRHLITFTRPKRSEEDKKQRIEHFKKFTTMKERSFRYDQIGKLKEALRSFFNCKEKNQKQGQKVDQKDISTEISLTEEVNNTIIGLTDEEKLSKAIRHFYDGYLLRTSRNDLDGKQNKLKLIIWTIINSRIWNISLLIITILYQFQVFFEPPNSSSDNLEREKFNLMVLFESIWLIVLGIDVSLNITFGLIANKKQKLSSLLSQKKLVVKVCLLIILLTDFLNYYISYPKNTLRFARVVRPILMICFSKVLRRHFMGVFKSIQNLLVLLILDVILILIWGFVGINLISDIKESINHDDLTANYNNFFNLSFLLYILSTMDFFPDIMLPQTIVSQLYLFYYIPFVLFFFFVLVPIPQALLYENFKEHRALLQQQDSFKQKKSISFCFYCLDDEQNGEISFSKMIVFFKRIYGEGTQEANIIELLKLLDYDDSQSFSLDEFFSVFLIIRKYPKFSLNRVNSQIFWEKTLKYIENKFHLIQLIEGPAFNLFMMIITLINCVLLILQIVIINQSFSNILEKIDILFFICYSIEALLKVDNLQQLFYQILAMGIYNYFEITWNKFDFFLVFFQFLFEYVFYDQVSSNVLSSLKANRVLRLAKIQKIFGFFKVFRSLKFFRVILDGFKFFDQVGNLGYKMILCIPGVIQFLIVIWIACFIFCTISLEFLKQTENNYNVYSRLPCYIEEENINWNSCEYSDFSTFDRALLMLLQILCFSWADILFDYSHRIGYFYGLAIFLGSFKFISLFFYAITNGIVWEVFNQIPDEDEIQVKEQLASHQKQQVSKQINLIKQELSFPLDESIQLQSKIIQFQKHQIQDNKQQQQEDSVTSLEFSDSDDFSQLDIWTLGEGTPTRKIKYSKTSELKQTSNSLLRFKTGMCELNDIKPSMETFEKTQILSSLASKSEKEETDLEKEIQKKFIPLSEYQQLSQLFPMFFNNQQEELNFIFNQSYRFFKDTDKMMQNNQKVRLRQTLKVGLGYEQKEIQQIEVIEQQKDLIYYFGFLLKQHLKCQTLVDVLISLDEKISNQCLPPRSFTQFIFESRNGQWFTITKKEKKLHYFLLGRTPWFYSEFLYNSKDNQKPEDNIFLYDYQPESEDPFDMKMHKFINNIKQTRRQCTDTSSFLLLCVFPEDKKQFGYKSGVKRIMHIWNFDNNNKMKSVKKISYLSQWKNSKRRQSQRLVQMADAIVGQGPSNQVINNPDSQQESIQGKHSLLQAINLCKDIWKIIRGREFYIRSKINDLERKRQKQNSSHQEINLFKKEL